MPRATFGVGSRRVAVFCAFVANPAMADTAQCGGDLAAVTQALAEETAREEELLGNYVVCAGYC